MCVHLSERANIDPTSQFESFSKQEGIGSAELMDLLEDAREGSGELSETVNAFLDLLLASTEFPAFLELMEEEFADGRSDDSRGK